MLVSICFGEPPESGPRVVRYAPNSGNDATIKFDIEAHVAEVLAGVQAANLEFDGRLTVSSIQVVPDDYPSRGDAQRGAYLIARYVITGEE